MGVVASPTRVSGDMAAHMPRAVATLTRASLAPQPPVAAV